MTTYRCAVIGNPIAHSQSPQIHRRFAEEHHIDLVYDKILAPLDSFAHTVEVFYDTTADLTPVGLNITLPFKVQAHDMAQSLTDYARYAGAVNTFYKQDGVLVGDNTDGIGLCQALEHTHGHQLKGKSVLILGAGGAARGAIYPLLQTGIRQLSIANRTLSKAQALISEHQTLATTAAIAMTACALDALNHGQFDVIINATSIGLENKPLNLPSEIIHPETICYDMVYGKKTPFLQWAEKHGAQYTYDGYSMLVAQARCSFARWFGV